jgi:hypothetical protein
MTDNLVLVGQTKSNLLPLQYVRTIQNILKTASHLNFLTSFLYNPMSYVKGFLQPAKIRISIN